MNFEYDVVIIGGAFSGAATALMLKRKRPEARVLIIEKTTEFDRKVGESTTEVSSCYLTRILGLTHYLGHHQLAKQGLRLWFSNQPDQRFDDCVEVGTRYQSRLPGFQLDRAKLDSHMLDLAVQAGCELWRPATVTNYELNGVNGPPTICSAAVGGSGSFRCAEGMSVPALCTTTAFSNFRKDQASANGCTRIFSAIPWVARFSARRA